jgi:hypothetical protein
MLDKVPGHPWQICWFPSEDVSISPEEADERVFLFRVEACPNHGGFAPVAYPNVDRLDLHFLRGLRFVGCVRLLWDLEFGWVKLLRCSKSPSLHWVLDWWLLLTPKNGTGKGLTCGPSLVIKYHSARKNLLRGFGKGRLRSAMWHHSAKGLFALL